MSELFLEHAEGKSLFAHGRFGPGLYCVTGLEPSAAAEFVDLATGTEAPLRGQVLIDGESPHSSPRLRAQIGSLRRAERVVLRGEVQQCMQSLLGLRGVTLDPRVALNAIGASHVAGQLATSLSSEQQRLVALALAAADHSARLLILDAPLAIDGSDPKLVARLLQERARTRPVLALVSSREDAIEYTALGAQECVASATRLQRDLEATNASDTQTLYLVTNDAARLAASLRAEAPELGITVADDRLWLTPAADALPRVAAAAKASGFRLLALRVDIASQLPSAPASAAVLGVQLEYAPKGYTISVSDNQQDAYSGRIPPPGEPPTGGLR